MRRTKLAIAGGLIGAAAIITPIVAFAAPGSTTATTSQTTTAAQTTADCKYPANKATLTIKPSSAKIKPGKSVTFSGTLRENDCRMASRTIYLYSSEPPNGPFAPTGDTAQTDSKGNYTFPAQSPTTTTYYRAYFPGDGNSSEAYSNTAQVTVQ